MASKKTCIPKTVHHNIEIKTQHRKCIKNSTTNQQFCDCNCCYKKAPPPQQPQHGKHGQRSESTNKYKHPQFNSVIGKVQEMQMVQSIKPLPLKNAGDLTPRTKALVAPKITQKLNFNPSQTVYKNLVPINVNDSILLPHKSTSLKKKYASKTTSKVPAPDLCDFLDPIPTLTHVIPEPEIHIQIPQRKFNYFEQYKKLYH